MEIFKFKFYSIEEIIEDLQKVSVILEKPYFTRAEYDKVGKYKHGTIIGKFGTWGKAIKHSGINVEKYNSATDEEILNDLERVNKITGYKHFNIFKYAKEGSYTINLIINRFGTWQKAIKSANIGPNDEILQVSDEELLEDIRRVRDLIGCGYCSRLNYSENGKYKIKLFIARFGTWILSVKKAGLVYPYNAILHSKEMLLDDLKKVANTQNYLSYSEYKQKGKYTIGAFIKLFGKWSVAIQQAGLTGIYIHKKIPDDTLLDDLKRVAKKLKKNKVHISDYLRLGKYGVWAIIYRFGNWNDAIEKAGLIPANRYIITKEELIADILRVDNGRNNLSITEYLKKGHYNLSNIKYFFGGWLEAKKQAGLQNHGYSKITDAEIIDDLKRVAEALENNYLTVPLYHKLGKYSYGTILYKFGSWNTVLSRAGLGIEIKKLTKEELIEDMLNVADGKYYLTYKEYKIRGKYSCSNFINLFKNWGNALESAGLSKNNFWNLPEEIIFEDLNRVAEKLSKKNIKTSDYYKFGKFRHQLVIQRFGSWKKAREKARLNESKIIKFSKEELLDDLIKVLADKRIFFFKEYEKTGKFSYKSFVDIFGGWKNAKRAAFLKTNNHSYED
ncbi:MAG: hypothetical protein WCH34_07295 [Bacteroidota bacterium]